jgi:hypothetical protein
MRPGVDNGRTWPLPWQVRQSPQGHLSEDRQSTFGEPGDALLRVSTRGIVLGAGAWDPALALAPGVSLIRQGPDRVPQHRRVGPLPRRVRGHPAQG